MNAQTAQTKWFNCMWYHGTNAEFSSWLVPPPPKQGEAAQVPHSAVFFSSDSSFAKAAGSRLCVTELLPSARVLDATCPGSESESLRQRVVRNSLAQLSVHVASERAWRDGWRSGEVLRFAFTDPKAGIHLAQAAMELVKNGVPKKAAALLTMHNTTRGLIELICSEARQIGFDALAGYEVDITLRGDRVPRPWLAVFNASVLKPVRWMS